MKRGCLCGTLSHFGFVEVGAGLHGKFLPYFNLLGREREHTKVIIQVSYER